jgi:hypothetical protein
VPDEHKTGELCFQAVRQNPWALEYVSDEHKTAELCLEAVKQDAFTFCHLPDEYLDYILKETDLAKNMIKLSLKSCLAL